MASGFEKLVADAMTLATGEPRYNGHSMVGGLKRVLVCSPRTACWHQPERAARWRELGFARSPDFETAQTQHQALCRELEACGAEVEDIPPAMELSLDAVYTHDASLPTDFGLILMRPGKANRVPEGKHHGSFCQILGIPMLAKITAPATSEAGDMVWLDAKTLLVGHGYRTNRAGHTANTGTAQTQRSGGSFRTAASRHRTLGLPALDVADQPAR